MAKAMAMATAEAKETELAWATGYFEGQAQLYLCTDAEGKRRPQLRLRGVHEELMRRCADALGYGHRLRGPLPQRTGNPRYDLTLTGRPAHELMKRLWPLLTPSTKREYLMIVKQVKE